VHALAHRDHRLRRRLVEAAQRIDEHTRGVDDRAGPNGKLRARLDIARQHSGHRAALFDQADARAVIHQHRTMIHGRPARLIASRASSNWPS